jgi:hypothetical protein
MSARIARFTRTFAGLIALFALLPPFAAAGQILDPREYFQLPLAGALYFGEFWIAVFVHEIGHAIAARMSARRLHIICVWPIAYLARAQRLTWFPKQGMGDIGGFVLATPSLGSDWRRGEVIFALGGVLANLASSAIAFAIIGGQFFGHRSDPFVGTFAVLSLVLAILNLVPIWGPRLARSDGAFFLDAIRRRQNPRRNRFTRLIAMQVDGVPPTEWDATLVEQVEIDAKEDPALEAACAPLYRRYLALGDLGRARAMLARIASSYRDAPAWVRIDEAFFLAHVDRDGATAQKILDKVRGVAKWSYNYWRAVAVARDALGDHEGVLAAIGKARNVADLSKTLLDRDDLSLLNALQRKAEMAPLTERT